MSRGDTSPGSRLSQQTNIDTAVLFYHSHSVAELVCSLAEICWEWIRLINGSRGVTDEQYGGRARRGQWARFGRYQEHACHGNHPNCDARIELFVWGLVVGCGHTKPEADHSVSECGFQVPKTYQAPANIWDLPR